MIAHLSQLPCRYAKQMFHREAAIWHMAGRQLNLWWRDDDARHPTRALDRLTNLAGRHEAPLTLAVIPDEDLEPLATYLANHRHVTTIQHGVDHVNRSHEPWSPAEFAGDYPVCDIARLLGIGRRRFEVMARHRDILAPPWNRAGRNVIVAAMDAGFIGASAFGAACRREMTGFARIDTHLDPLRWNDGVKFRGGASFYSRLARLMRERRRREDWHEPVGLLTHHLQHDTDAWEFLDAFLAEAASLAAIRWRSIGELISLAPSEAAAQASRPQFRPESVSAADAAWGLGR